MIALNPDRRPDPPARWVDDTRRIAVIACVLLVTLRLFIGWQLAYEGFWKVSTLDTVRPWTSAGYLANAQGPFRDLFRGMTGDPDDRGWLDYDTVNARWNDRYVRFKDHYDLTEEQDRRVKDLIVGPPDFRAAVREFPEGVEVPEKLRKFVQFNPQAKRIIVDGRRHLTAEEKDQLLALVAKFDAVEEAPEMPDGGNLSNWELAREYTQAIERVYKRATNLSYRERLAVALRGDPDAPRVVFGNFRGTLGDTMPEIGDYYDSLLREYREALDEAETDYQREHAEVLAGEIGELKAALIGPVKALDAQLNTEMYDLLTAEQRAKGPVPQPWDAVRVSDTLTITGLCTLGTLLMIGFLTRFAAALAGLMVFGFYLAWPPWPGVPEAPGPDHALVVNKNLIEVAALFALAALPTGRWFGVDALLVGLWRRFLGRRDRLAAENAPVVTDPAAAQPTRVDTVRRDELGRETMPLAADDATAAPADPRTNGSA